MLRHQSLLKCRCRMLFNDLKVFLLRRPPAPSPPLPMDSGDPRPGEPAANNNTLPALHGGRGGAWRAPAAGGGGPASPPEEEWGSPAGEPLASAMSSASSEDFCKGKAEDRYSLGSSLDSGMRTPLCRICFQGPEQVTGLPPSKADETLEPIPLLVMPIATFSKGEINGNTPVDFRDFTPAVYSIRLEFLLRILQRSATSTERPFTRMER
ncbi:homeobox protein Meis1 [Platysternon megacephalum]|uniref:Homeobox protein Meis1 n=1 Tax=Platysternon megacephalum TaxID=55544 RepID=A0A4D9EA18_9SAUR|nr:homeobox protein Meis1 [Platysternon megacephalum]